MGKLQYFLIIEVARSNKRMFICKEKYILDLLYEIGMLDCKPVDTPIEVNHKLQWNVGKPIDVGQYQWLVGRLIYLSYTRPNIVYVVSVASQYMHHPWDSHLDVTLRIFKVSNRKAILLL